MGATRRTASTTQFFEIKHFCLWREIKTKVQGCDEVEVTNPRTKVSLIKYGYAYEELIGHCVKLEWYDTKEQYDTRYFGFKLTMMDQGEKFVLTLPYKSIGLRRIMMAAPNVDWARPLCIRAFKGKDKNGKDETAIWLSQEGAKSVKAAYTKDNPNGLPPAVQDEVTKEWDFKKQLSWLAREFKDVTGPLIEAAGRELLAAASAHPVEDAIRGEEGGPVSAPRGWRGEQQGEEPDFRGSPEPFAPSDDDVPF